MHRPHFDVVKAGQGFQSPLAAAAAAVAAAVAVAVAVAAVRAFLCPA